MSTPITEDFSRIAAELKRLEEEKAKIPATPLPEVQPDYSSWAGFSSGTAVTLGVVDVDSVTAEQVWTLWSGAHDAGVREWQAGLIK